MPFDPNELAALPFPDDISLDEAKGVFNHDKIGRGIASLSVHRRARIRFIRLPDGSELPGNLTVGEFRILVKANMAAIVIDDGEGGISLDAPAPSPMEA